MLPMEALRAFKGASQVNKLTYCVAVAVAGLGGQAVAGIINVPAEFSTLQAAINAADDGDEIVVAPGTYTGFFDFMGRAVTVRSSAGNAVTVLDAGTGHATQWVSMPKAQSVRH